MSGNMTIPAGASKQLQNRTEDFELVESQRPTREEIPDSPALPANQLLQLPTSRGPTDPNRSLAPNRTAELVDEPMDFEEAAELVQSLKSVNKIAAAVASDFERLSVDSLSPGEARELKARILRTTLELSRPPFIPAREWNEVISQVEQLYPTE